MKRSDFGGADFEIVDFEESQTPEGQTQEFRSNTSQSAPAHPPHASHLAQTHAPQTQTGQTQTGQTQTAQTQTAQTQSSQTQSPATPTSGPTASEPQLDLDAQSVTPKRETPKKEKRVCIIGAGIGGIALAIRLQAAGLKTLLIEGRDKAGGWAAEYTQDGFAFGGGPSLFADPDCFGRLWSLTGHAMAEDIEWLPMQGPMRLNWSDGVNFDLTRDTQEMRQQIEQIAPGESDGFYQFLDHAQSLSQSALSDAAFTPEALAEGISPPRSSGLSGTFGAMFSGRPLPDDRPAPFGYSGSFTGTIRKWTRNIPELIARRSWRSAYGEAAKYVKSPRLREVLSFHTLLTGGNPMRAGLACSPLDGMGPIGLTSNGLASAGLGPASVGPKDWGSGGFDSAGLDTAGLASTGLGQERALWWPRGGSGRLVAAMLRHFQRLGGTLIIGDPLVQIHTIGNRANEVELRSGTRERVDVVACNADPIHLYRDLLGHTAYGKTQGRALRRQAYSPGMFLVHFALEGSWPGIPHQMVLFSPRFEDYFADIFDNGVLPQDMCLFLSHPTITDSSLAPKGRSLFTAALPVPNMGKLTLDWQEAAPMLKRRILDEIGRRLVPDIDDRIITCFTQSPRDAATALNAHLGSGFGPEPSWHNNANMRTSFRDKALENLYLLGASIQPGAGIEGVTTSAKMAATAILEDLE